MPHFEVLLPVISLLFERAPYSNLILSPSVNQRQVQISSLAAVTDQQQRSLIEAIHDDDDNTSFASRLSMYYPYRIAASSSEGSKLSSIAKHSYKLEAQNQEMQSVTVMVDNGVAQSLDLLQFKTASVFFNIPMAKDPTILNFRGLLRCYEEVKSNKTLLLFLKRLRLPRELCNDLLRFEVNLHELQRFTQMCLSMRLSCPEGQHRIEVVSRVCYGYECLGKAPLRDETDETLEGENIEYLRGLNQLVSTSSTVYIPVPCSVLYTWSQKLDAKLLQMLQSISAKAQLDSKTEV